MSGNLQPEDRTAWLLLIGRRLRAEYDVVAEAVPPRLAALIEQLETSAQDGGNQSGSNQAGNTQAGNTQAGSDQDGTSDGPAEAQPRRLSKGQRSRS
jgi:hypothetical protein